MVWESRSSTDWEELAGVSASRLDSGADECAQIAGYAAADIDNE